MSRLIPANYQNFRLSQVANWLVALVAGSLLGLSLLQPNLWPLVFVGAVLSFYCFDREVKTSRLLLLGLIIGATKISLAIFWFWSAYPLDWMGISNGPLQLFLISLYWLPASITLGSGLALFAFLYKRYLPKIKSITARALSLAVFWVMAEVLGAFVFSVYTLGPGSSASIGFSFGFSGYALAQSGLLALPAKLGGVYVLSFLVALISFFLYKNLQNKKVFWSLVASVFILYFVSYPVEENNKEIKVALVETQFSIPTKESPFSSDEKKSRYLEIMKAALDTESDYVVLPEDSRLTAYLETPENVMAYLKGNIKKEMVLIDSSRNTTNGITTLRAFIYDTKTSQTYYFDKQYLVPQGEYVPYLYQYLISLLDPGGDLLRSIKDTVYEPGIDQMKVKMPNNLPNVLFCFESVTPFGVKDSVGKREDVPFIAHLVSHAWFNREPQILWNQLDAMLITQAKFNNLPILQASNKTAVKAYLPSGEILQPKVVASGEDWEVTIIEL